MKTPPDDHDLIRWLDDEMPPAESAAFEARLNADPQMRAEADEMRRLSQSLRAHVPREMPVPHADFFNSQIQMRIAQLEMEDQRQAGSSSGASWLGSFWFRLFVPATAVIALAAGWLAMHQPRAAGSAVISIYTPDPKVQATTRESEGATVLMLEGLDAIPADQNVAGLRVHHSATDAELATTTLFDSDGNVLLVMSQNHLNQPQVLLH